MSQQLTFKEYRNFDLISFAVLSSIFEILIVFASNKWILDRPFTVSIIPFILILVTMRWNYFSAIHAVLGGAVYSVTLHLIKFGQISYQNIIIYSVGNCFCLFSILLFKIIKKEKVKDSVTWSIVYTVLVFLLIHIGHTLVSLIFKEPINIFFNFMFNDSISLLFSIVLILILRKLDGVFEDQKAYLFRIQREEKEKQK